MFQLSAQNNFYIVLSSYVEEQVKKNPSLNFMSFDWFPGLQNLDVFWKIYVEQVLKSFSGANNSVKPPVFGFCDSLTFGIEESREFRALIRWVLG